MHTYKVNTGHEAALEREVARLKELLIEREDKWDEAKTNMALMTDELEKLRSEKEASTAPCGCQGYRDLEERNGDLKTQLVEWRDRSMGYTKEIGELKSELEELSKAYNDEHHETQVYKKAWREQQELVALRDDQIAMLERRLAKHGDVKEDMEDQTKLVDDLRYHINAFMAAVEETIDL